MAKSASPVQPRPSSRRVRKMEKVKVRTVDEGVVESLIRINERLVGEAIEEWDRGELSGIYFCDFVNGYVRQKFWEMANGN